MFKVKVGIIGSGNSALTFVKALNYRKEFDLVAIGSRNHWKAKQISKIYKKNVLILSIQEVIESKDINLIIICLPGFIQPKIICDSFKNNKNVICEKPMSIKLLDAELIYNNWKKYKKIGIVNFCYNFIEEFKIFKKILKKNKFKFHTIYISWLFTNSKNFHKNKWKKFMENGGGALYNFASHILNFLFPAGDKFKILSVNQFHNKNNKKYFDNFFHLLIKKRLIYNINISSVVSPNFGIKFLATGERGSVIMENYKSKSPAGSFKIISLKQEKNSIKSRIVHKGKYNINLTELYLRTLDYFLSIKKSKKQQYPLSIKEGYENIKLINQIRKFHK